MFFIEYNLREVDFVSSGFNARKTTNLLSEKLRNYIKDHCPSVNESDVSGWLNNFSVLKNHFKNRTEFLIPDADKKEFFLAFVWGLMAQAVEKGDGFTQGTIKFEDEPDYRIVEFFRPIAYLRPSSHYKGRVTIKGRAAWLFNAYAIDDHRFPAGHRTAIFAPVATLHGEKKFSFLKTEDHAANPFRPIEFGKHCLDYLKSRPRVYNWQHRLWAIFSDPKHTFREEDMPIGIREELLDILKTAPKTDKRFGCRRVHPEKYQRIANHILARMHKYGIAGVWASSQDIIDIAGEQARVCPSESGRGAWKAWGLKVLSLREKLQGLYPEDVSVRKGNEVVLPNPFG